ncbi:MAG: hypothetical protein RLZZ385_1625 [Pseudomonadota bacterium]|jgi:hypothetical protein
MNRFKATSTAMDVLNALGMRRLAWSLRRLHCPVPVSALVLDVGSGGNPYPRANVLLDGYEETSERYFAPLVKDRPIVYGTAERMPFKDKVFDFVIASHILEHTLYPEFFISELMRVGKAGYIETPDGFFERINPFRFHRLEVYGGGEQGIRIFKKPSWRHDGFVVDGYEAKLKQDAGWYRQLRDHPLPFYTRLYWNDRIDYTVVNPEVDADWPLPAITYQASPPGMRRRLVQWIRRWFSQNARNANLDLAGLLCCPRCHGDLQQPHGDTYRCGECGSEYAIQGGIADFTVKPKD